MQGAVIGGVVAVVAWLGVWAYLQVLRTRLDEALSMALATRADAPATVEIVEVTDHEHGN